MTIVAGFFSQLNKMILSFPFCLFSVLDGVFRAIMIAGVAGVTMAVPMWAAIFNCDVLQRAHLSAHAARDAGVGGKKRLVGCPFVESAADDIALESR